ncbi:MAG: response regulator [Chloroflexota bacterium]
MTTDSDKQLDDSTLLNHLLTVSNRMASMRSLDPLLTYVVDEVLTLVGAESGYVVLVEKNQSLDIRVKRHIHDIGNSAESNTETESAVDTISHSILDDVLRSCQPIVVQNALMDPNFFDAQSVLTMQLRSVMCAPLRTQNQLMGALYVENRHESGRFSKENLRTLEFFSHQAAIAIENAHLNENLEQLVASRTQELNEAKERAEEANRTKSLFLSSITHELRTPMNGVLGMATLLNDTSLNKEQQEMVNTIHASGDTLLTLINDILDFSKIEANKLELEQVSFELEACIEDTFNLVRPSAEAKNLGLAYEIDQSVPPKLIQDVTRVRQILTNLVSNAVKFTNTGSVDVNVYASLDASSDTPTDTPAAISTDTLPNPSLSNSRPMGKSNTYRIYFAIKDTGIGIPKDRIGQLFRSFSQVDATTTRKYGGTGLGLAISKQLCEMMGGEIWVESVVGVGSIFHFTITAQTPSIQHTQPQRTKTPEPSFDANFAKEHPLRILLAEDNVVNQKVALGVLKKCGYTADVAANGMEAINALQRQPYDVILMDVHMPEMDGLTATQQIRQRWTPDEQPTIIALTADAMEQQKKAYLGAGMDDFVTKPIRVPALMNALQRVTT